MFDFTIVLTQTISKSFDTQLKFVVKIYYDFKYILQLIVYTRIT